MPQFINKFSTLFILILLVSCAELDSHSPINRFKQSENLYQSSMRWGEWINVFQLQKSSHDNGVFNSPSDELLTHLSHIKVTHTEALSSTINEDKTTGSSLFLIEYHFDNSAKIKTLRHKVGWWHNPKNNIWYTSSSLPEEFDLPETEPGTIKLSPKKSSRSLR